MLLELSDACDPPSLITRHSVYKLEEVYIMLWCCLLWVRDLGGEEP